MTMLDSIAKFYAVNGSYITTCEMVSRLRAKVRGKLIGSRCGSKDMRIGSRPHIRGLHYISIGDGFEAEEGLWLEAVTRFYGTSFEPRIVIGQNVNISKWSHITAINLVEIGSGVLIGSKVLITDHGHGSYDVVQESPLNKSPMDRPLVSKGPVRIGANVWIGDGAVILSGSTIGEGAIIGANSVVTSEVPAYTIAAGNPLRMVRKFDFEANMWTKT